MDNPMMCEIHKRPLVCPACMGAKGGARMSEEQLRRNRRAAKVKAQRARRGKRGK